MASEVARFAVKEGTECLELRRRPRSRVFLAEVELCSKRTERIGLEQVADSTDKACGVLRLDLLTESLFDQESKSEVGSQIVYKIHMLQSAAFPTKRPADGLLF